VDPGPRVDAASFRDPAGFVFWRDGRLYRQVNRVHAQNFDLLRDSGLYDDLTERRLLVPHQEVDVALGVSDDAYRVLEPERVGFISYPYEWSFEMLRDAALATLAIQDAALDRGMSLRDATAFNLAFHRGHPLFLDTTSFEMLPEGRPWVAYRQFCQHFLAPLALMAYRDVRLGQLHRIHVDGVPLDLAAALLPARSKTKAGLTMHLRMHARSQRKHGSSDSTTSSRARPFSTQAFRGLVSSLRKTVEGLPGAKGSSVWRNYYSEADHYSSDSSARKEQLVEGWVNELRPSTVWDLGANTGRFAKIASSRGIDTLALDVDPFCVDEAYRRAKADGDEHLLPLVQDLTNPSTGIGWADEERSSLESRGPADLVMALAVIHHLAIANNVPLAGISDYFARLGRHCIVEFVPKNDPKVQVLLKDREDVFEGYTIEGFEGAVGESFTIQHREPLADSGRTLFLLKRR
jgi:hypothetical protein